MLLSDSGISLAILGGDISFGPKFKHSQIQASSIDLTIGKIFIPEAVKKIDSAQSFSSLAISQYLLGPGDSIIVELDEEVNIGVDYGGLLLPPNALSKNGIIMTNPGHIDPGYKGLLTVCLINMGSGSVALDAGSVVATLLLHRLETPSQGYAKGAGTGVSLSQLSKLGKDFANLSERSSKLIGRSIKQHLIVAVGIISLTVAILAIVTPGLASIFSDLINTKYAESKNATEIEKLTNKIDELSRALKKQDSVSSQIKQTPNIDRNISTDFPMVRNQ